MSVGVEEYCCRLRDLEGLLQNACIASACVSSCGRRGVQLDDRVRSVIAEDLVVPSFLRHSLCNCSDILFDVS
ncbi:hypothetical protein MRB53_037095 [Persea americana]|nr:hypothetical protein MRB53_037095 [Persea americana]